MFVGTEEPFFCISLYVCGASGKGRVELVKMFVLVAGCCCSLLVMGMFSYELLVTGM